MGRNRKGKNRRIDHYRKAGKTLTPPLASLPNVSSIDYNARILPNLLWIEAVRDYYGDKRFVSVVHGFVDLFDDVNKVLARPVSGLVQSFDLVPVSVQQSFVKSNSETILNAVIRPFVGALRMYPSCPMAWLASDYSGEYLNNDLDSTLSSLKRWTSDLSDRGGPSSNMARAIVLARYLKAGKLKLPPDRELIDGLAAYPNCEDRELVESSIRAMTNMLWDSHIRDSTWARDFWQANGRISVCTTDDDGKTNSASDANDLLKELGFAYATGAGEFLAAVKRDYLKCYPEVDNFEKTCVVAGLLSRTAALLSDILTQGSLWVGEIGGILLRCMCETLILSAWLITRDDKSLYQKFVLYSLGQADLYGLKIEGYEGYREMFKALYLGDDGTVDNIVKDKWAAQLRTIDLGNWAGIDTRKMAEEGGTKTYYDLIFTECSSDVHSQFMSLARWNMIPCSNPLHNYHLLPAFGERRLNPFLPLTACVLAKETCSRIFKYLHIDAECVEVLAGLLNRVSTEVLKNHANGGDTQIAI